MSGDEPSGPTRGSRGCVKVLAGGRECEGPALKQGDAEKFLQLNYLAADGGLLNAIGHAAHGLADAPMFGHVVEKFEVMDVHVIDSGEATPSFIN